MAEQKKFNFRKTFFTVIVSAFGFVMALTWNEAIKAGVNEFLSVFSITGTGYVYKIIAAMVITIICMFGLWLFARWKD